MIRLVCLFLLLLPTGGAAAPGKAALHERLVPALKPSSATAIGRQIFMNEADGRREWLVQWLPGEDHLSLGIGHFIWYPAGRPGPFRESFVELLAFLERRDVPLPGWLASTPPAPWPDRAAFLAAAHGPKAEALRAFLERTVADQVAFMTERLARAVPVMLEAAGPEERAAIERRIERLLFLPDGRFWPEGAYPLIDYVNFKGDGTHRGERYQGTGWGLLQVLEEMTEDGADRRAAFAEAAARVLTRRVALAPPERREARWLDGWLIRLRTYRTFEVPARPAGPPRERLVDPLMAR